MANPFRLLPLLTLLGLTLLGGLVLPIGGYMVSKRLLGPYTGKWGLTDYLSDFYAAAGRGELLAWWVLLTPLLITGLWYLVFRLGRGLAKPNA